MSISGDNTQDAYIQSFPGIFAGNPPKNNFIVPFAAPADGSTIYEIGLVVGQVLPSTASPNASKFTYYSSAAVDGTQIPVGIITDMFLDQQTPVAPGEVLYNVKISAVSDGLTMMASYLKTAVASDNNEALLTALGGKKITQGGVEYIVFK